MILNAGIVIHIKSNNKVGHNEKCTKKRQTRIQEEPGKSKNVSLYEWAKLNNTIFKPDQASRSFQTVFVFALSIVYVTFKGTKDLEDFDKTSKP